MNYNFIGLKFWKAPNSRIFAVPEEDIVREAGPPHNGWKHIRTDDLPPDLYMEEALVPLTENIDSVLNELGSLQVQLKEFFKVKKTPTFHWP